ncbi:hypothetical protein Avbf_06796 [Armadillidium vulgare]|nr:hypothetical protein Avbf_06796 [Armadillidium vulgare]
MAITKVAIATRISKTFIAMRITLLVITHPILWGAGADPNLYHHRLAVAMVWRTVAEARLVPIPVGCGGVWCLRSEGCLWASVWLDLCEGGWGAEGAPGGQIWQL